MIEVTLLTRTACDLCDHAKHVLERLAPEFQLSIQTLSLDAPDGQTLASSHGLLFPPGVLLDGEPFSYGRLSERRLRRELTRRLAPERR